MDLTLWQFIVYAVVGGLIGGVFGAFIVIVMQLIAYWLFERRW